MSKKGRQAKRGVQEVQSEQVASAVKQGVQFGPSRLLVKKEKAKAIQLQSQPPTPVKGKKSIWHKEYSYSNSKGTKIIINGHWETIDESEPKKKVAPVAKDGAEGEGEEEGEEESKEE